MIPRLCLERDGFAVVPAVLSESSRHELLEEIDGLLSASPAGVRDLVAKVPAVRRLARSSSLRSLVEPVLGSHAQLVRSILFNKSEEANWQVAWHQDLTIAVRRRADVSGFDSWSDKEGVPHVQPPMDVLQQMLTVRLHLDAADETNGALWVSPGSHRLGRLPAGAAAIAADRNGKHLCRVDAGDALLLRPLILHASRKATSARARRVIHLEFAGAALPAGVEWHLEQIES